MMAFWFSCLWPWVTSYVMSASRLNGEQEPRSLRRLPAAGDISIVYMQKCGSNRTSKDVDDGLYSRPPGCFFFSSASFFR